MAKITTKEYYCPTCGNHEKHSTNHTGEIYCSCKACGNSVLYCAEIDPFADRSFISARINCYKFNLEDASQATAYRQLRKKLSAQGLKCFETLDPGYNRPAGSKHLFSFSAFALHAGETIRLYDPEQWPDQFVSNIGRVHLWAQTIYPNRKIKHGYYLSVIGEGERNVNSKRTE